MNINNANFLVSFGLQSQLPASTAKEIVMSGRSNVGKSSLLNKVCNRKSIARVSSEPGKTITINFYSANDFHLVDLPGYGYARVSDKEKQRWAKLIDGYFETGRNIALVVQLLDCRHEPSKDDYTMLEYLTHHNLPFVIALTKGDKLNKAETIAAMEKFKNYCSNYSYKKIILTSADKNTGIEELKDTMEEYLRGQDVL